MRRASVVGSENSLVKAHASTTPETRPIIVDRRGHHRSMSQLALRGEAGWIGNGGRTARELVLERGERDMGDIVGGLVGCIRETGAQDAGKL